jgi:hypothetical protein
MGWSQDWFFTLYQMLLYWPTSGAVELRAYSDDWDGSLNQEYVASIGTQSSVDGKKVPSPSTFPVWKEWVLRRVDDPAGAQIGSITAAFVENVNTEVYKFHGSGLVLQNELLLPDFARRNLIG